MFKFAKLIIGITGVLNVAAAGEFPAAIAADKGLIVRAATLKPFSDDRHGKIAIETVNPATGETESIWTGFAPTNEVRVSPDAASISFIEPVRYVDGKMEYESTLRVIGFDGIERHTVPGVRRHRWSPDSRSIVYLTGPYAENGQGFKSAGTFIYDLASKESKQIAPWGYDATWAAFDGAIYIWYSGAEGKDVLRYDPATGALTDTPYRDIFFSPDGLYYYRPSREGTGFELRLTATNENVVARWPFLAIRDELIYPRGWIDDSTLVIPASHSRSPSDYVFNLNEGVPRQANGEVIGYTADKKSVYVLTEGGITTQPLAQMTVVPVHGSNLSVLPQSDDGAPFAYRILGDVELVSPPRRVEFSDSGNHLMVQYPRHDSFLAVYTDAEKDTVSSKELPGADGGWVGGDTLVVRIPESSGNVALPSYTRVAVWEDEARSGAVMDTIKQWAFAAWTYVENSAFRVLEADGAPVFDTWRQLQAASRAYFIEPSVEESLAAGTFASLKAASDIYFVNEEGHPVYQDENITHSTQQLFLKNGESLTEITVPESRRVFSYHYDSETGRVLAETAKSGVILFDVASGERVFLPKVDQYISARYSYRLIPGAPYIVATIRPLSRTVDPWLELWTNDGDRLMTIPTGTGMRVDIVSVQVSPTVLAVALKETATGTHGDEERHFLRIFAAEK